MGESDTGVSVRAVHYAQSYPQRVDDHSGSIIDGKTGRMVDRDGVKADLNQPGMLLREDDFRY